MLDFIVVGAGLAGIAFAETCLNNDKSVVVFNNVSQKSSKIAAGIYNPVILKRYSGLKDAILHLDYMNSFYADIERKLDVSFDYKINVLRKFASIEDQNNWYTAADKTSLSSFLSLSLIDDCIAGIYAPFKYGRVLDSGFVDTTKFLVSYQNYLTRLDIFKCATFDYNELIIGEDFVSYNGFIARNIVFAEGFGLHSNPYFNYLPLDGTKGEILIIKAKNIKLVNIINGGLYIVPLGNSIFKIGATYNWDDKTDAVTESGKQELRAKLADIVDCDFEIIDHLAAVRPTVKDRKALLGTHPKFKNLHIINGLGTRGVMLAPYMSKLLFDFIENGIAIDNDINIDRYQYLF